MLPKSLQNHRCHPLCPPEETFMPHRLAIAALGCLLSLSSFIGCSSGGPPKEDETTTDLRNIAGTYELILSSAGKPPREVAQIKKFLAEFHEGKLNPPADEVLTSARD